MSALEASPPEHAADFVRMGVFSLNLTLRAKHWLRILPPHEARTRVLAIVAVMQELRAAVSATSSSLRTIAKAYRLAEREGIADCIIAPAALMKPSPRPLDATKSDLVVAAATRIPLQRLERAHYMIGDRVIDRLRDRTLETLPDETWDEYAYHAGEIAHKLFDHAYSCRHELMQVALLWPIRYGTPLNVADTMEAAVEVFALLGVGEEEPT